MKVFEKVFGGTKMTWPRLIAFSVIVGVLVGVIMLIPALKDNAIHEIGVGYEMWFILAIFVIVNCKSTLDAGMKCFIFFLISQPLIYLVQQPFASVNLIGTYYGYWFIQTLLTFPGAMIAYQIKRKNMVGTLILSVAGLALGVFGTASIINGLTGRGISYVIYGIVQLAAVILFAMLFCPTGKTKTVYAVIVVAFIALYIGAFGHKQFVSGSYDYTLEEGAGWTIQGSGATNADISLDGNVIHFAYSGSDGRAEIACVNDKGEEKTLCFSVVNGQVVVEER